MYIFKTINKDNVSSQQLQVGTLEMIILFGVPYKYNQSEQNVDVLTFLGFAFT